MVPPLAILLLVAITLQHARGMSTADVFTVAHAANAARELASLLSSRQLRDSVAAQQVAAPALSALPQKEASGASAFQPHLVEVDAHLLPRDWNVTMDLLLAKYLSNTEMAEYMQEYAERCSNIARLFSWGTSSSGNNELLALELSIKAEAREAKPYFRYAANIHGDEPSGRTLVLLLAEWLCANHRSNPQAKRLVRDMHLVLVPSLNPDGFALHRRGNAWMHDRTRCCHLVDSWHCKILQRVKPLRCEEPWPPLMVAEGHAFMKAMGHNVDLNRNFPDPINDHGHDLRVPTGREQNETLAIMRLSHEFRFVASLNLHEGSLVANYPFDGYPDGSHDIRKRANTAPDDTVFTYLAHTYANRHPTMSASTEFPGGITNGAHWYPLYGGMQDWSYLAAGCLEITVELNHDKWPGMERLRVMWEENREALVETAIAAGLAGLRGRVFSTAGKHLPLEAIISVAGGALNTTSLPMHGDFYRPLPPGSYTVTAAREGYLPSTVTIQVPVDGQGIAHDFYLHPEHSKAGTVTQATALPEVTDLGSSPPVSGGTGSSADEPERSPAARSGVQLDGGGTMDRDHGGEGARAPAAKRVGHPGPQWHPSPPPRRRRPIPTSGDAVATRSYGIVPLGLAPAIWTVLMAVGIPVVLVVGYLAWRRLRGTLPPGSYLPVSTRVEMLEVRSAPTGGRPDYSQVGLQQLLTGADGTPGHCPSGAELAAGNVAGCLSGGLRSGTAAAPAGIACLALGARGKANQQ